jgi:two-component system, OmpR family, response regulator
VQFHRSRILVLDEHEPSLVVLCRVLASRGHTCDAVSSAADALDLVASLRPRVVLYEWYRRDGRGLGLAKALRAACALSMMVIAVSALDQPHGFCATEEVDAYITKPFDVARLESLGL